VHTNPLRRRSHRGRPAAASAAFVAVITAVGAVTRAFGTEAGLLATLLAVVALVISPHVYINAGGPERRPEDPDDHDGPGSADGTRQDRSAT
jgi:hypothetical protein